MRKTKMRNREKCAKVRKGGIKKEQRETVQIR